MIAGGGWDRAGRKAGGDVSYDVFFMKKSNGGMMVPKCQAMAFCDQE
jgi:hypothetical protein